jgi:signal transduction histidine kinase
MIRPKIPNNEKQRLRALNELRIVDTLPEREYDELTELAAGIAGTEISLVSLITEDRQWFKSRYGLDAEETSRDIAFCAHAINEPDHFFEIENAKVDERFTDNPLVTDAPKIRYYGGVPLKDESGMPLGTLCVIDSKPKKLTDHQIKLLQNLGRQVISLFKLRKKNIELEKELERKSFLYKILSHDLKGPIGSYSTLLKMLSDSISENADIGDKEKKYYCDIIDSITKSSDQSYELILSILEWSTNVGKSLSVDKETVMLSNVVSAAQDIQSQLAERKAIKIVRTCAKDYKISTDINLLGTIVRNLIGNAIKFTPEGGKIIIDCTPVGNSLKLTVNDSGIGLTDERLQYVKNLDNYEISRGTSQEIGYGLGLKVCTDISQTLGTQLEIESEPGKGTSASIYLEQA